ncbi:MAG: DUF962 domain-containing protein [Cyanobacteria bacterium]|nr:DUF962 domain-containing protein [Cyanobacteriota bacterium]
MSKNGSKGCASPALDCHEHEGQDALESSRSCPFALILPLLKNTGPVGAFVEDYIQRHRHPVNASLHIVGVPMAFSGLFMLLSGRRPTKGLAYLFFGYLLQYLGHKAQGNEVGEVTLAKSIYNKVNSKLNRSCRDESN